MLCSKRCPLLTSKHFWRCFALSHRNSMRFCASPFSEARFLFFKIAKSLWFCKKNNKNKTNKKPMRYIVHLDSRLAQTNDRSQCVFPLNQTLLNCTEMTVKAFVFENFFINITAPFNTFICSDAAHYPTPLYTNEYSRGKVYTCVSRGPTEQCGCQLSHIRFKLDLWAKCVCSVAGWHHTV